MNPDQERKAKEKQLRELEEELGLVSRRKLETRLSVVKSDLEHAKRMASSRMFIFALGEEGRKEASHWHRQISGMLYRTTIDWG